MSTPKDIDRNKGKIPQKEKGSLTPIMTSTIEETRRHQLERLAAAFRLFAHYGFDEGLAGHITLRDPEFNDHFWVNPLGMNFAHITVSDLLLVKEDGKLFKAVGRLTQQLSLFILQFIKQDPMLILLHMHTQSMAEHFQHWEKSWIQSLRMLPCSTKNSLFILIMVV